MPFTEVTIEPKTTPDIDDPGAARDPFWPMIGAANLQFKISAIDQDGMAHGYSTPLLFVFAPYPQPDGKAPPGSVDPGGALKAYGLTSDASQSTFADAGTAATTRVEHNLGLQRLAVAPKDAHGDAAYQTQSLRFAARFEQERCEPSLLYGNFIIPAVAVATGRKDALKLSYATPYANAGFDPATNTGEVVLQAPTDATYSLEYGTTDRSGGFLTPSQHIDGISRGRGPVADVASTAAGNSIDPSSLFSGLGKILGLFELADVLPDLGSDHVPSYAARLLDAAGGISAAVQRIISASPAGCGAIASAAADLDALLHQSPAPSLNDVQAKVNALSAAASAAEPDTGPGADMAQRAIAARAIDVLTQILEKAAQPLLAGVAGQPSSAVLNHVHLEWQPPVKAWPAGSDTDAIFLPDSPDALLLAVDIVGGGLVTTPSTDVIAQLSNFRLQLVPGMELLHIHFKRLFFRASTGAKSIVDVELGDLEWRGVLGFVDRLRRLIPMDGFTDPPTVAVDDEGIATGFSVGLPAVSVGVFNLANLSLAADLKVPFVGDAPSVGFAFCARERPFNLSVLCLGGGGFLGLRLSPNKLVLLEASVEFGATLALDLGVASGSVSCMAGIYLRLTAGDGSLTGYVRIRGQVSVLAIASASLEMYMSLTYEFGSGKVIGDATVTVEIEVLCVSKSVSISARREFAGSTGDPTFAEQYGPYSDAGCAWLDYCHAFAEI